MKRIIIELMFFISLVLTGGIGRHLYEVGDFLYLAMLCFVWVTLGVVMMLWRQSNESLWEHKG